MEILKPDARSATSLMRSARHASVMLASAAVLALAVSSEESPIRLVGSASAQSAPEPSEEASTSDAAERRTDPSAATVPQSQGSVDVDALMEQGALPDVVLGDPNAPVTIVEYASLTCPHCATFHNSVLPDIKADYVDTGIAKVILREFPFDPAALAAFMLARCVPQDRREAMISVLFQQQQSWARAENVSAALLQIARMSGMSQEEFVGCLQNTELQAQVAEVRERGESEFGVQATPTFFVNGERYSGAMGANEMAAVIESHR